MPNPTEVVVEADGGSRGNPGPAAYGAVLRDAATGRVLAECAEHLGVTTNNVAEYRGLVAGLDLYRRYADGAALEVRLDSQLVVEQMAGRWRIKNADLQTLAQQARDLAPPGTRYTWIPRAQNAAADALANEALDAGPGSRILRHDGDGRESGDADTEGAPAAMPTPPWEQGPPTTLVLVRHGETDHTRERRFSGRSGANPPLNATGRAQVEATAEWLAPLVEHDPVLLASPMQRTRDTASALAARLGREPLFDEGLLEAGFGAWEGLTFAEVIERDRALFARWVEDHDLPAGGHGDALSAVDARMAGVRERLLAEHAGRVVVAATHLTPIKLLVRQVLDMPLGSLHRTEIGPASVTVLVWYPDGRGAVRLLNGHPTAERFAALPVR